MKKETYVRMTNTINSSSALRDTIIWADRIVTKLSYIAYPVFLVILFMQKDSGLLRAVLVPGISFVVLSIFRKIYNAPRPYEVFGTPSVIKKDTRGKSFPSRHVFSIFVIAATVFQFYHVAGTALAAAGIIMAAVRVLGGVHFTKDVIVGAAVGIICAAVGFAI